MRHQLAHLYVHLVWSTWGRAPLITPELQPRIYAVMQHQATKMGAQVIAIGGIEDHVHALVRFPTTVAIGELVGRMKGASSYFVTRVLGRTDEFRWQGAYGAFTVSRSALPRTRAYVLNQAAHHRDGTTHPALEADHV